MAWTESPVSVRKAAKQLKDMTASLAALLAVQHLRKRENLAIRGALGARTTHFVWEALGNTFYIALPGTFVGLVCSYFLVSWIESVVPAELPRMTNLGLDLRVAFFGGAGSLAVAALAGLVSVASARRVSQQNLISASISKSRRSGSGISEQILITLQMSVGFVLLCGALLFTRNLFQLLELDLGFEMENVYSARFDSRSIRFGTRARRLAFFQDLLDEVRSRPGIENAALAMMLPLGPEQTRAGFRMDGHPGFSPGEILTVVDFGISEDYFKTLGIPLVEGTDFDRFTQEHGCIVNRALADRIWSGEKAVGRILKVGSRTCEIAAVAENTKRQDIRKEPQHEIYRHYTRYRSGGFLPILLFKTGTGTDAALRLVTDVTEGINPNLPKPTVSTLHSEYQRQTASERFYTLIVSLFAACTLLQAAISLFALVAFAVRRRVQEIGVRMALGARPSQLVRRIILSALPFSLTGLILGGAAYIVLSRLLQGFLFVLQPNDPLTLASATLSLLGISLVACWIPARWATRIDPARTLRVD